MSADLKPGGRDPLGLLRAWFSTSALYLSGVLLPPGGVLLMLLTPQPGLELERRRGMAPLVALVTLVTMTAGAIGGVRAALFYLSGFALLTVALPVLARQGWSIERTVGSITLILFVAIVAAASGLVAPPGELLGSFGGMLERSRETLVEIYRDAGMAPQRLDQLQESLARVVEEIVKIAPALGVVSLGLVVLLNVMLIRWRQRRAAQWPIFGDLTRWQSPPALVWGLIGSGYALLLPLGEASVVATNVLAILVSVYFCQGLSVVQFYFSRWQSPRWMRVVFYAAVVLQWLFAVGVVLLGIFDLWADFRRLQPRPIEEEEE